MLFVPVARYSLPVDLPFGLSSGRSRPRSSCSCGWPRCSSTRRFAFGVHPLDAPVALIVVASLGSVAVNYGRVVPLASTVLKGVIGFLAIIVLFYFISSVVTSTAGVVSVTQFLVCGVAVVAFFAIVEQRTGFNIFDHVRIVFPFLQFRTGRQQSIRYGLIRAVGSADHAIALGVLLAMAVPLGVALAKSRSPARWAPTSLIMIGVVATASRTAIIAIAAAASVFLWLRPRDVRPLLPLTIPLVIVIKIVAPGSLVTLKEAFLPSSGPG